MCHEAQHCVVLKLGHFGQEIQKFLENIEMWSGKRMEKISWTDHVDNRN
jgi:hypothetical protein